MKTILLLCVFLLLGGYLFTQRQVEAQDAPAFVVGQRYSIVWNCLPIAPVPCYGEVLEVRTVWRNGWLTVRDTDGELWTVNPARAIGYQPYRLPAQVSR